LTMKISSLVTTQRVGGYRWFHERAKRNRPL
jgi:hypothetical protein